MKLLPTFKTTFLFVWIGGAALFLGQFNPTDFPKPEPTGTTLIIYGKGPKSTPTPVTPSKDDATKPSQATFTPVPPDTSGFRPIYMKAADKFSIPWQILEAVHQIETGKSGDTTKTSYAGAQGPMQFMPKTWDHYKQDGDGDGIMSKFDVDDAIFGAANLLAAGGAAEGRIREALFNYNHSYFYVDQQVMPIAKELGL